MDLIRKMGDANENEDTEIAQQQQQQPLLQPPQKRRSTKYLTDTAGSHHVYEFKLFTRDSLINIRKRKSSKAKKHSAGYLDPTKQKPQPDPYLASGQQLPPALARQLPVEMVGKPIEDIDPYYADHETFVIISRGKELTRFSATKALGLFGPFHPIRRVVLCILVNPLFNLLVILTILVNCILMTIQSSETVEKTEIIFTIVYTTEMGLKVLARGFVIDRFTYLRDPWNWLDFAVIIMAYLTIVIQDLGNLSVIRTFRVLRALKTVAIIPGMKTIVGAVIDSVKNLKDVVVLTLFSLSVFSLLGLQIYMGQLTQKCILNGPNNMTDVEWFNWCSNSSHWVPEPDDEIFGAYRLCGNATGAQSCPSDHTCIQGFGPNPDYGYTNFDTFGWALICSFRLMTQDFWEGLYMQILKTAGSWHIIFFIISIFLGSIYLMNLILAIVAMSYNELQRRAEEEEEAAAEDEAAFIETCLQLQSQQNLSDFSSGSTTTYGGGRTSYRPSVEIGLVGQNLLTSLCQNGLLDQHVRARLNQQMMLPDIAQSPKSAGTRSYSLSVNFDRDGAPINKTAGYYNKMDTRPRMTSMVPGTYHDPLTMVSSMTELRRKSSVRTNESGSLLYPPAQQPQLQPTSTHPLTGSVYGPASPLKKRPQAAFGTPLASGEVRKMCGRKSSSFFGHHVSSGVLATRPVDNQMGASGSKSARSSTISDRDIDVLRQTHGDNHRLGRNSLAIQSADVSDESTIKDSDKSSDTNRLIVLYAQPNDEQNRRLLTTGTALPAAEQKRRSDMESNFSARFDKQFLSVTGFKGKSGTENNKGRTKSHDFSTESAVASDGQHSTLDPKQRRPLPWQQRGACDLLEASSSRFRSENIICKQPSSIYRNQQSDTDEYCETPSDWPMSGGVYGRRSIGSYDESEGKSSLVSQRSCLTESQFNQQRQQQQQQKQLVARLGGSTRTLQQSARASHANASSIRMSSSQLRLGIDKPDKMHHLSVENFQQFGLTDRSNQRKSLTGTSLVGPTSVSASGTKATVTGWQPQAQLVAQQPTISSAGALGLTVIPQNSNYDQTNSNELNTSVTLAQHHHQHPHQHPRRAGNHLSDSRGYIHPETMARSSLSRPRQSVVFGMGTGQSGARRMSQDFVRRASDWSRLSMSGNIDLRRLLRLWAHTNPYQGRPSIGSWSNYSQQGAGPLNGFGAKMDGSSPPQSINQSPVYSRNSPRVSSAGSSARQAYELISALSRRHNRYPTDQRYALPIDDNMVERMSVNLRDKSLAYCLSCLDIICIWECCGLWLGIQRMIDYVVFDPFTELFIIFCILINTLFMALDSDDVDVDMKNIFERGNYFFTAIFAVEASMKIMAMSPKFYFREGWNVFDSIIVGLSLVELGLEGVYGLSVLRSFRLLRVFKLAKSWPTLNLLISIMGKAVGDLGNLTFVLAIIVFIFAVMGMQLFGNKYVDRNFPSGELPRWNFTDFMHSFMIVFRILCAEWIEPMWDCLLVGGWPCIPFFLIAVTVGNLVVLNLFLALLLASFGASNLSSPQSDNVDTQKLQEAIARFTRFGRWIRRKLSNCLGETISLLLGRQRASGLVGQQSLRGGKERAVKSHIARMSKLERTKIIEQRTEELKSRIRRSPEHHYHLKQLAKLQLKESTEQNLNATTTNQLPQQHGFNFNYKRTRRLPKTTNILTAAIPIIVKEASDGDNEIDETTDVLNSTNSPLKSIQTETKLEQASERDEEKKKQISLDELQLKTESDHRRFSSAGETSWKQSHSKLRDMSNMSSCEPHYRFVADHVVPNMQAIREDSRDADSSNSLVSDVLCLDEQGTVSSNNNNNTHNLSLDKLTRDEISLASNRWRSSTAKWPSKQLDGTETCLDDSRLREPLMMSHHSESGEEERREQFSMSHAPNTIAAHQDNATVNGKELMVEEEELERPKSSLYLKAPKREDMEEEDEQALQHIETYIEKCICFGIICLKWFLFRQYVRKIVEHRYFDQCILVLIVISSGTLALEDKHLNERPNLRRTLDILDTIFTIIFSLEMIFKWLAFGMKRYFGNIWSWLDFIIVLVSFVNLMASIFGSGKIQALKTMRTLRAMRGLRPLRALQRFQGMRVVVNALIQAIPSIFNVLLVCLIFWLIFSIMGVQMFGGKFWRCLNPNTRQLVSVEEAANRHECIERNLTWANPQINFDNVLNAYLALFQVATFKGWIDIMNSATDSRMRDDQPIREANIYMYFYFVFFVIFGSFFTLNLFIGVIIDNFNEQKKKTGGSLEIFMTDDQKKYYHAMKKMRSKRPIKAMTRPKLKLQAYMFDITTSKKFDMAIMLIIGLNMFVMALEHHGQSQEFSIVLENLNLVFIAIFTLECLCKIFAMRHFYFREPWNIFDFIVVALSILGVVMKEYVAKYFVSPTLLRVVRVVKVGRVLRLVKGAKGIRTLLFALAMSLPALFNICLLLFLVMFIYAIFGMSFFMNVRKRSGIDETFNFETFASSIIVLFQMSTSAGWDLVLDPLMDEENDCTKPDPALGLEGTCGNRSIAIFYLISYVIVTFLIIINMYIAVILENYSQATEDVQEGLTDDDYEMYYEIWQKFDPDGTQYLPYEMLSDFVDALEDPLRIPKPNTLVLVLLDINIYEGNQCYCVDILDALTKYFFTRKGLVIQVNEHLQKVQSTLHETPFERISTTYLMRRRHYCAYVIQKCWRKWKDRTSFSNVKTETVSECRE